MEDLQKIQNNTLRIIHGYRLNNSPSLETLHNMSSLLSLKQRREKQLLHLVLWFSKCKRNLLKKNRITRLQERIYFKVLPLKTRRYINSPMNRGNILWNKLTRDEQHTFSNPLFKTVLDKKKKRFTRHEIICYHLISSSFIIYKCRST